MSTAERDKQAQELRAQGLKYREIAERLGESTKAVWRRCNRDHLRSYERGRNQYKREYDRRRAKECVDCGARLSDIRSQRCVECAGTPSHDRARERTARWLELRGSGLSNFEIAEREGVTTHVVTSALQRRRVARFPDLEWLPAPYMQSGGRKAA